jgi:Cysteine-rich secretory protein family
MHRTITTLLALTFLTTAAFAQKDVPSAEQTLLQFINQHRGENDLQPLIIDPALSQAARAHAVLMSQQKGDAQHQYSGEPDLITRAAQAGAHFHTVSENVVSGSFRLEDLDRSWMKSDAHRANILDPKATAVGISVIDNHGSLYIVEDFAQAVASLSLDDIEKKAQQQLSDQGIKPAEAANAKQDARKACETKANDAPNAIGVMQWDGADFSKLSAALLQHMPQAREHTAAVGACPNKKDGEGFTTYRAAVLIY